MALPPAFSISPASVFNLSSLRAAAITSAPSSAKRFAVARPMPALAPATNATLPANLPAMSNPPLFRNRDLHHRQIVLRHAAQADRAPRRCVEGAEPDRHHRDLLIVEMLLEP